MKITLKRESDAWFCHGKIQLNGQYIADTTENHYPRLAEGTYVAALTFDEKTRYFCIEVLPSHIQLLAGKCPYNRESNDIYIDPGKGLERLIEAAKLTLEPIEFEVKQDY